MSDNDLEQKLRAGIDAAKSGNRATARRLLEQVVSVDENNELAWIWLASSVNTVSERRNCLQKVLQINPDNARAREALQNLGDSSRGGSDETSRRVEQIRRAQQGPAQPPRPQSAAAGGLNWLYLLAALVIIIVVIGFGLLRSQLFQPPPPTNIPFFAQVPSPTRVVVVPTSAPAPFRGTRTAPTLPPTFTPTATPTASDTPTPTITPYPLAQFVTLVCSLKSGSTAPALYRVNGDGTGEQHVADDVRDLVFDPSGKEIAFVRDVTYPAEGDQAAGTFPEIFVGSADDPASAAQVTTLKTKITASPTWSQDGSRIAFVTDYHDGTENIWTMTVDGKNPRRLTQSPPDQAIAFRDPAWSPIEDTIVFASDLNSPGSTEIYSMNVPAALDEAPNIVQLTDASGSSYSPSWSPDGKLIAFISDRNGDGDVFTMDPKGNNQRLLTFDDGNAEDRHPVFTPDKRYVAFISNRQNDTFQVYLVNLKGTELVPWSASTGRGDDQSLAFRPELLLRLRESG